MEDVLDNPVFNALLSGNSNKALGSRQVKYFDAEVSPFAGFPNGYEAGFDELQRVLPAGRKILFASRKPIAIPHQWKLAHHIPGTQFLFRSEVNNEPTFPEIVPLNASHVTQMVALARLTKPGPFDQRTIEFGNYEGIFEGGELVAMTGRRLHVYDYLEVSAVCTHPSFLGKGYAGMLLKSQLRSILNEGKTPFLHVRSDNERAISLYKKLGFEENGPMHFYFLQK